MTPVNTKKQLLVGSAATPDDVEAAFYEGLQKGDLDQVMACWAEQDAVACIHPGGPRLMGIAQIRDSFHSLFSDGGCIPLRRESVKQVIESSSAVHHVMERLYMEGSDGCCEAYVLATNVFVKTTQGWRLLMHHASPGTMAAEQESLQASHSMH